jgi:uncharacterized protein YecT (DUF1311 family)
LSAAYGAELSKEYIKCISSTAANLEWHACSEQEIDRQEKLLTEVWKDTYAAMKKVSVQSAQMLLNEQRAWLKFKDAACLFYSSGDFGREGQVLSFGACKAMIIAQRVEALRALMKEGM